MTATSKRRRNVLLIAVGSLVVGGLAVAGAALSDEERIAHTEIQVAVAADGSARVEELIDYDFGTSSEKHGIYRDVPGIGAESGIEVRSDAPDEFVLLGDRIRIGDPDETISGRHTYEIGYRLADVAPDGKLAFNAVGAGWDVPITDARILVTGPYDWSGLRCDRGGIGEEGGCDARQVEPGTLEVVVSDLEAREGVSIYADDATPLAGPAPVLPAFGPLPDDDSPALLVPFLVALVAALLGATATTLLVRRAGREWVGAGGAADAAFPSPGSVAGAAAAGIRRIDERELASLSTIDFAPPPGIGAPYGGVVLREQVRPEHQVAWLIEQVSGGSVALDDGTGTQVLRFVGGDRPLDPVLARAFNGRTELPLGTYDADFAAAWGQLGTELSAWRAGSGLWDPAGERNRTTALLLGTVGAILGAIATGVCAFVGAPVVLGVAAVLAGAGLAALASSGELRIRTATARRCGSASSRSVVSCRSPRCSTSTGRSNTGCCASTRPGPSPSARSTAGNEPSRRRRSPRRSIPSPPTSCCSPRPWPAPPARRPRRRRRRGRVASAVVASAGAQAAEAVAPGSPVPVPFTRPRTRRGAGPGGPAPRRTAAVGVG